MKALVIDDNPDDFKFLIETAKGLEQKVEFVNSVNLNKSIKIIDEQKFDIIFLDLMLPDTSERMETVTKGLNMVKNSLLNAETPVIILTGSKDFRTGREALKLGAKDFLDKENLMLSTLSRSINFVTYDSLMIKRDSTLWSKTKKSINQLFSA